MMHRASILLAAALMLATPLAHAASSSVFYVPLNRSELVSTTSDMSEVIVTDPDVADVFVHGKRKVSVIGKTIGQTTLRAFDSEHKLIRSMDVTVARLRRLLEDDARHPRIIQTVWGVGYVFVPPEPAA